MPTTTASPLAAFTHQATLEVTEPLDITNWIWMRGEGVIAQPVGERTWRFYGTVESLTRLISENWGDDPALLADIVPIGTRRVVVTIALNLGPAEVAEVLDAHGMRDLGHAVERAVCEAITSHVAAVQNVVATYVG